MNWLIFFTLNQFKSKPGFISFPKKIFEQDWAKVPIDYGDDNSVEEVFADLNDDLRNNLGTPSNQEWLKNNGVHHTSMSVGDIVQRKNKFFVCLSLGWTEIKFIEVEK